MIEQSLAILERTPRVLDGWLRGLPEFWVLGTEGGDTWSPYTVVGHLIHCEKTDWIPRTEIILNHGVSRAFDPFDREAQFRDSKGKTLETLLDEFAAARQQSLRRFVELNITEDKLALEGTHPTLGRVTLRQLLSCWTAHDLAHLTQIARVMARQYREEVGPWAAFLSVMKQD